MLQLGFSTCPNDTFIFDALVHSRILNSPGFEVHLADVSELNQLSLETKLDVTKLSFGVISDVSNAYQVLDSGSALGFGCGPLLIARSIPPSVEDWLKTARVAIPGEKTTANLLLSMAFPNIGKKIPMLFSDIEDAVVAGHADAGLIIHENRFTYQAKGLFKLIDLGEFWEAKTGLPVPLGCIAVKRSLPEDKKKLIQQLIRESVEFAFKNPEVSSEYVSAHAQEMDPEVMNMHIKLYVNQFSVSLGRDGRNAVNRLMSEGIKAGIIREPVHPLFVDPD
ncbi:MAG: 1,4-dihydroxy-6-naphthoate synthase [Bacteroidetes bacterium]|nr:1,4-dihydroxy-6-naphthoate synthase [Bacteroidota bacterium]